MKSVVPRLQDDKKISPQGMSHEVGSIMNQVLLGTRDLNENGIAHRDIKLANICFGKDDLWKIIDFGLARVLDEAGGWTQGAGTDGYIPPDNGGPKHDVFSCAVVWYELMTGKKHGRRMVNWFL